MKSRILITLMIGLLHASSALSQSLTDYYRSADGLRKDNLKTALYKIISDHKTIAYKSLFDYYEQTDGCLNNPAQIFDMFSTNTYYFVSVGNSMNKEHVVPQSWWGGGNKYPIYSDMFNVLPSDSKANSSKSNYPLGKITGDKKYDNGRIKIGKSSNSGGCGYVFEPYDEFKGDFARIYLYDATCYQNINWDNTAYAFPTGKETYPTLEAWIIPILLEWNKLDPPSEWEITRNNRVYQVQNNRNPFIDYPQLAEYIWGDSIAYNWDLDNAVPNVIDGNTTIPTVDPEEPTDPENPTVDPEEPDDPTTPTTPISGNLLYAESFDEVKTGNSTSNSGSSDVFDANECDSISSATWCYCAGGAIRVGKSKAAGSISTTAIPVSKGNSINVVIEVKGWETVEGDLEVSITGASKQTISYTAKMGNQFESKSVKFENIPSDNPILTLATTDKRCFINSIRVYLVTEDPVDPTDPEEPTVDPTDPEEPTVDPVDPTDPEEPTVDPTDPTDPEEPSVDPEEPTDPDQPTVDPEEPTEPTDPDEPTNPEVVGIGKVSTNKTNTYYDLFGRKIIGKPTKSGIYIFKNKKIIIK